MITITTIIITLGFLFYVLEPLTSKKTANLSNELISLNDRKQHYTQLLKDLELDMQTEKIDSDAYNQQKAELSSNLASILNNIESLSE